MKNTWSVFHSWLLHLNKSNLLSSQRRESFSIVKIIFDFIIHYVKEIVKSRWNMNKKNSNFDFSLNLKNRKSTLQYKVEYKDDDIYNIKFIWQNYIDTVNCLNFVINFHYKYLKVVESHWTFKKLSKWELISWINSTKFLEYMSNRIVAIALKNI